MIETILSEIYSVHPTQQKKIEAYFTECPQARDDLVDFLQMYSPFMKKEGISAQKLAASYSEMISQMMYCRLQFLRTGKYLTETQIEAFENVYNNETMMSQYMFGSALSQFLWKPHHRLLNFYKYSATKANPTGNFLEIGCGHGLYVNYVLQKLGSTGLLDVVDISETSIYLAKSIIASVNAENAKRVNFIHSDINLYKTHKKYDFIGMGEVLEHVDDPLSVLKVLHSLLSDDGRFFITTCANCPTVDHVYLFNNIDEIRALISKAGFLIDEEIIVPSEDKPDDYLQKHKVDISYGAILKKRT